MMEVLISTKSALKEFLNWARAPIDTEFWLDVGMQSVEINIVT